MPLNWELKSVANNPLTSIIKPGVDKFSQKIYLATADVSNYDFSNGSTISFENRESRANI